MTEKDLDFSGFQTDRKVNVPPPPKKKAPAGGEPEGDEKKAKKKKKKVKQPPPVPETPETVVVKESEEPEKPPRHEGKSAVPGRPPKPGRKKRVNVSLPVELSRRFTERAAEEDRYLTDMVLDAYRDHYAAMRDEHAEQDDPDLPFRPRRRKTAAGRVTHMLYLAAPELAVIDGSAEEIGLARSEFVSQLLERELQ